MNKKLYQKFETNRLVFFGDTPDVQQMAAQAAEVAKNMPKAPEAGVETDIDQAAKTPKAAEAKAEEMDTEAKAICDKGVDECQTDLSRLNDQGANLTREVDTEVVPDAVPAAVVDEPQENLTRSTETTENQKANPEQVAQALFQDRDLRLGLIQFMAPGKDPNKIDQATFTDLLKSHQELSQVIDNVKTNEEGDFDLTPEGRKALGQAVERVFDIKGAKPTTAEEMTMVGNTKLGKKTMVDIYGREAVQIFATRYDTRMEEGSLQIKIGDTWRPVNEQTIGIYMPPDIQTALDAGDKKAYEKLLKTKLTGLQSAMMLRDLMGGQEANNNMKTSLGDIIKNAVLIMKMIKEGMETGDFGDLEDVIADVKNGRDVSKSRENARLEYENAVAEINNPKTLLNMHENFNGGEAARRFGNGPGKVSYRNQLKAVIEGKLANTLGAGSKFTEFAVVNGTANGTLEQGGRVYKISMQPGDAFTKISMNEVVYKDGVEQTVKTGEANITGLEGAGSQTLEGAFASFKNETNVAPETETMFAENTTETPEETPSEIATETEPTQTEG